MHVERAGKTQCLAGEAFEARPQGKVLTFALLHRQLPQWVLLRREMTPIDTRLVRIITGDTKGGQEGFEFQGHRILAGAYHGDQYSRGVMIDCRPQPPCLLFGPDKTPQFIELGGAAYLNADGV